MKRLFLGILFLSFLFPLTAQNERELDVGAILAFELDKKLYRDWSLSLEEELRFNTGTPHKYGFDDNRITLGLNYKLSTRFKVGANYCYIYTYNNDYFFESRHRFNASLTYEQPLGDFSLSWRTRFQTTFRDENRGSYKINPKNVWRNKIDLEYKIFGSPWRPSISADFASTLNDPMGNELYRIRYQASLNWRRNRTDSMDFFLRMDHYLVDDDPNVISLGVSYKIRL